MNLTVEDCHIGKQLKGGTAPEGAQGEGQSPSAAQVKGGSEDQQPNPPPPRLEENTSETRTVEVEIHPQTKEESQGDSPPSVESQGDPPPSVELQGDPPTSEESKGVSPQGEDSQSVPSLGEESQGVSPLSSHGDNGQDIAPKGSEPLRSAANGGEDSQGVPPQGGIVPGSVGVAAVNGARQPAVPDIPTAKVPLETVEVRTEPTTARAQEDIRPLTAGEGRVAAMTGLGGDIVPDPLKVLDKGKRVGPADLLPLTQGVASNNAKLVEPQVPTDFTPTAEWVRHWYACACAFMHCKVLPPTLLPFPPLPSPPSCSTGKRNCLSRPSNDCCMFWYHRLRSSALRGVWNTPPCVCPLVWCVLTWLPLPLPSPGSNVTTEKEVLEYLKNGTLVGLLPIPHPILIRKYQVRIR